MSYTVVIDPGHAPGNKNKGNNGYYEYKGMWLLSNFLKEALLRCGFNVKLTRSENEDPSLEARGKLAASINADLFISEHSNAANGKARGVEVYYSLQRPNDLAFASILSSVVATVMHNPDRGPKTKKGEGGKDYYGVIRSAADGGVKHIFLIENGFHDNSEDEAFLLKTSNLKGIAEIQAEAICLLFNVKYIKEEDEKSNGSIPQWQLDGLDNLIRDKVIEDETYWKNRFTQNITVGEVIGLMGKAVGNK